jgi:hypothetical protein
MYEKKSSSSNDFPAAAISSVKPFILVVVCRYRLVALACCGKAYSQLDHACTRLRFKHIGDLFPNGSRCGAGGHMTKHLPRERCVDESRTC